MFPNRVLMERDAPPPQPMVNSFIYICQSPQLRSFPKKWGKNMRSLSTGAHVDRSPIYITTPVPHSLQHDTFHLGLGRPEPQ